MLLLTYYGMVGMLVLLIPSLKPSLELKISKYMNIIMASMVPHAKSFGLLFLDEWKWSAS